MNILELYQKAGETALINALYDDGDEDSRLSKSKASQVEFLTTMRILGDYRKRHIL